MIILDTMIISSLMKAVPDPVMDTWLNGLPATSIWITSITVFEIAFGIELMPEGTRRRDLRKAFDAMTGLRFGGRILDLDSKSAEAAAAFIGVRRRAGRPVGNQDAMIAGIASASGCSLATRNTPDFELADIELINPWALAPRNR